MFNNLNLRQRIIFIVFGAVLLFGLTAAVWQASALVAKKSAIKKPSTPTVSNKVIQDLKNKLKNQTKIKKFNNLTELKNFLETNLSGGGAYNTLGYGVMSKSSDSMSVERSAAPQATAENNSAGNDYSRTNVQVEGVDEADIIKSDGEYVYALVDQELFIIKAYPADKKEIVSKIAFKSRPVNIYVQGNRLAVAGGDDRVYDFPAAKQFKRRSSYTFFKVFDITDRKNPKQVTDLDFEGYYSESRLIGDYVYLLTSTYMGDYWDNETPLPRILKNGKELAVSSINGRCPRCPEVYYFDMPYDNYNYVNVSAINIQDASKDVKSENYLLSSSQNIYVSQNNLYITYTKYLNEYEVGMDTAREIVWTRLSQKQRDQIAKIESADSQILSPNEKKSKIYAVIERYRMSLSNDEQAKLANEITAQVKKKYQDIASELEKTVIHKIAIKGDQINYQATGEVSGQALNQFSMDENNGYFRIATTKNRSWSSFIDSGKELDSYSNLYVLDKNLKLAGSVEKLAPGERIYSTRFMQNRAYLVTFKQTDPLFVVDLANPAKPKVLGELKVPGFSNYLHPYDENTLIGLGKDTSVNQSGGVITQGLKISLFDVSNVAQPKEIDSYIFGGRGSDSIALQDHKAFLFSKSKNLLAIPATLTEQTGDNSYGKLSFSGAIVFNIDKTGIKEKGRIDHSDGGQIGQREPWFNYDYYDNTVKRSLYIKDVLYTFSSKYLKLNQLDNLAEIGKIELKNKDSEPDYTIMK